MQTLPLILLSGLGISIISITGLLIVKSHPKIARYVDTHLRIFTAISAGVFLVTSFLLIRETIEILHFEKAIYAFIGGIVLYLLLNKVLSPHRHLGHDHVHDHKKSAWKILIGDTIHNIADGLLLVASFGAGSAVGLSTALSIALHEAPQEVSEFLVLKKSGYSNTEAVYRNFATAFSIFVGIALGLFLVQSAILQAYLLGITATFFLGIVFTDLFPVKLIIQRKEFKQMFSALLIGVIVMTGISSLMGHSHEHDEHAHEELGHFEEDEHHDDHQDIELHNEIYEDHGHEEHHDEHL